MSDSLTGSIFTALTAFPLVAHAAVRNLWTKVLAMSIFWPRNVVRSVKFASLKESTEHKRRF